MRGKQCGLLHSIAHNHACSCFSQLSAYQILMQNVSLMLIKICLQFVSKHYSFRLLRSAHGHQKREWPREACSVNWYIQVTEVQTSDDLLYIQVSVSSYENECVCTNTLQYPSQGCLLMETNCYSSGLRGMAVPSQCIVYTTACIVYTLRIIQGWH